MFDTPVYFEPTFDKRDSYIFKRMSGLLRVEGRSLSEVAHLATLGVNYAGTGILGVRKIKAASNRCFLSQVHIRTHREDSDRENRKTYEKSSL